MSQSDRSSSGGAANPPPVAPLPSLSESSLEKFVLGSLGESVIVTDLAGKIIYWNEGATATFGYSAEEVRGKTPALLYPDAPPSLADDLERILAGEDHVGYWRGRRKDGSEIWIDVRTTVMRDESGQPIGFVGVAEDATARRRDEAKLQKLAKTFIDITQSTDLEAMLARITESARDIIGAHQAVTSLQDVFDVIGRLLPT